MCINISMLNYLNKISTKPLIYRSRQFLTTALLQAKKVDSKDGKEESARMKQFHKKMKLQPIPMETDPTSGELITNSEKDPTKWGDWQNGGRVSDF
ncbi:uncharacterized protein LOC143153666 [Ptiloglossa arizonensis]|uniref:uncharacterized protein LOC143153666 n=1 Tax=Ptiloglossa arizonensis TaxID=3350558 RepID=UPI003FA16136